MFDNIRGNLKRIFKTTNYTWGQHSAASQMLIVTPARGTTRLKLSQEWTQQSNSKTKTVRQRKHSNGNAGKHSWQNQPGNEPSQEMLKPRQWDCQTSVMVRPIKDLSQNCSETTQDRRELPSKQHSHQWGTQSACIKASLEQDVIWASRRPKQRRKIGDSAPTSKQRERGEDGEDEEDIKEKGKAQTRRKRKKSKSKSPAPNDHPTCSRACPTCAWKHNAHWGNPLRVNTATGTKCPQPSKSKFSWLWQKAGSLDLFQ